MPPVDSATLRDLASVHRSPAHPLGISLILTKAIIDKCVIERHIHRYFYRTI
jgi:hypothetical protein